MRRHTHRDGDNVERKICPPLLKEYRLKINAAAPDLSPSLR
jgi:hypothetical protein